MEKDKFLGLLGICRKAGKTVLGFNKTTEAIKQNKVFAVFVASNISAKTLKELEFSVKNSTVKVMLTPLTIEQISARVGAPCGIVAVTDNGFAEALLRHF